MKIEFVSKNYKASDHLKELVTEKLQKLNKYFEDDASIKVNFKEIGKAQTMEVTVKFGGSQLLRAETSTDNMFGNIDLIIPKLERQIRKFRTRISSKLRDTAFVGVPADAETISADALKIVKVKKFDISIVAVEDAIEEMELLGHTFYIFVNAETNKVSVVYKRNDQSYGLITPEY